MGKDNHIIQQKIKTIKPLTIYIKANVTEVWSYKTWIQPLNINTRFVMYKDRRWRHAVPVNIFCQEPMHIYALSGPSSFLFSRKASKWGFWGIYPEPLCIPALQDLTNCVILAQAKCNVLTESQKVRLTFTVVAIHPFSAATDLRFGMKWNM